MQLPLRMRIKTGRHPPNSGHTTYMRIATTTLAVLLLASCTNETANEALGTLERDRIVLKATAGEIILDEPVPEGSQVAAGTLLVQLDDRRQQALVARARAEVAQAEARLEELRNGARRCDRGAGKLSAHETIVAAKTRGPGHSRPGPGEPRFG